MNYGNGLYVPVIFPCSDCFPIAPFDPCCCINIGNNPFPRSVDVSLRSKQHYKILQILRKNIDDKKLQNRCVSWLVVSTYPSEK
jgi:hypothetical protein